MKKWKWLLMNGCEGKSPISTAMEFLNSSQGGINVLWIMVKNASVA
jgi:hypothetical protein